MHALLTMSTEKLLDTLSRDDYYYFVDVLQTAMNQAKRTGCGKQVLAIDKKMHRFPSYRNAGMGTGLPQFHHEPQYQTQMYPPPFANNYTLPASAVAPSATDMQDLQRSGMSNLNGDTVEGASMNEKVCG